MRRGSARLSVKKGVCTDCNDIEARSLTQVLFLTSKYKNHFKYNLYQISLNFCQWNCFKTLLNVFKMSHTLFSSQPYFNYRVLHVFRINTPISRVGFLLYSFHITSSYSPRWALVVLFVRVTNTIC